MIRSGQRVHVDPAAAIPPAEATLKDLPWDAFRVYALRTVAGSAAKR